MENLRNRIDVKLVNEKDYLKQTSKPSYTSQKKFDKDLVALCKNKATLKVSKIAYVGMCILDLNKVIMYEFHYDYIKINMVTNHDYYSLIHTVWCMKLKSQ